MAGYRSQHQHLLDVHRFRLPVRGNADPSAWETNGA